jgi:alkylhydroperoxidase family enzyme
VKSEPRLDPIESRLRLDPIESRLRLDPRPGSQLAILRTLAHDEPLLAPFLGWAAALAGGGALSRRDSELLALRAAWNCRSAYEWGHHNEYARAAGLSEAEIARVAAGPEADGWSERDRLLLRAADELHATQRLDDATWAALRALFSDAQLVEIPLVVGHYTMLSMLANATGVPLEPGLRVPPR